MLEVREDKPITKLATSVRHQDGVVALEGTAVATRWTSERPDVSGLKASIAAPGTARTQSPEMAGLTTLAMLLFAANSLFCRATRSGRQRRTARSRRQ